VHGKLRQPMKTSMAVGGYLFLCRSDIDCLSNEKYPHNNDEFPTLLQGRLWHTTSVPRYQMIIETGEILPNPQIPDQERWCTSRGPEFYPFVRSLGGVSLFDFKGFTPRYYRRKFPLSCWMEFVPYRRGWGQAVWIEINRQAIRQNFISTGELLAKWKLNEAYKHNIMPMIEAAHLGPIPLSAFTTVLKCGAGINGFEALKI